MREPDINSVIGDSREDNFEVGRTTRQDSKGNRK
ncbi:hypothetical protein BH18THE2_BH18THE2_04220 [soil metagenome]